MTKQEFARLTQEDLLLLDGATGSNLIKAGMPRGGCPEQWVLEHSDVLAQLQRAYVETGSQVVYAPTFGANRCSLERYGLSGQIEEMIPRLVRISQDAVEGRALVAGDLTTTGEILEPAGEMTYEELVDIYREQISLLAKAGVDLLVGETLLGIDEAKAILDAAADVCDLPVMCSLTLQANGSALYGGTPVQIMETLQEKGAAAVGVNCSVGPDQLEAVVSSMRSVARVPVIAKPNAGMPTMAAGGEMVYSMTSPDFTRHMKALVNAGAQIIGGCCGTTPDYIRELAQLKKHHD